MINISDLAEHLAQYAEYAFAYKDREELERILIEYFDNANNGWIPVSERLPEDGILVLIKTIVENNLEPTVGSWSETLGTWEIGNDAISWDYLEDSPVNEVMAWMPLPEPLKEGN